jgi:hypothetical protein
MRLCISMTRVHIECACTHTPLFSAPCSTVETCALEERKEKEKKGRRTKTEAVVCPRTENPVCEGVNLVFVCVCLRFH